MEKNKGKKREGIIILGLLFLLFFPLLAYSMPFASAQPPVKIKESSSENLADELLDFVKDPALEDFTNIRIIGLMGMATYTDDEIQIRKEFRRLKGLFTKIHTETSVNNIEMKELSMGMTADYKIAIEEGSTLIRIGTAIFGARNY